MKKLLCLLLAALVLAACPFSAFAVDLSNLEGFPEPALMDAFEAALAADGLSYTRYAVTRGYTQNSDAWKPIVWKLGRSQHVSQIDVSFTADSGKRFKMSWFCGVEEERLYVVAEDIIRFDPAQRDEVLKTVNDLVNTVACFYVENDSVILLLVRPVSLEADCAAETAAQCLWTLKTLMDQMETAYGQLSVFEAA